MDETSGYVRLISARTFNPLIWLVRGVLRLLSWDYRILIAVRNWWLGKIVMATYLDPPTISVGNITVGGTGKTPMTIWLCEQMLARGRKPAVLSRGYKASEQGGDEILLVSQRCPEAVAIAHPDRGAAGRLAVSEYGVQAIILDDGFQHRRVYRDLDIVLIDATRPFGFGYLLPRGLLREPVKNLRRCHAIVITRADQCDRSQLDQIEARIREVHPDVPMVGAVHRPAGLTDLDGQPFALASRSRIGCFAGIARPEAFLRTLAGMGHHVAETRWWQDHHDYSDKDIAALRAWAHDQRLDVLVTTEKDAVKLRTIEAEWSVPVAVLRVDMVLLDDGEQVLAGLIDEMLKEHEDDDESIEGSEEELAETD